MARFQHPPFGVLAEKISEDDFRVMMGDHHSVDRAKLPPQVLQAVSAMQPGQVSDLVGHWHPHSATGITTGSPIRLR
jgi:hypothetical protein